MFLEIIQQYFTLWVKDKTEFFQNFEMKSWSYYFTERNVNKSPNFNFSFIFTITDDYAIFGQSWVEDQYQAMV